MAPRGPSLQFHLLPPLGSILLSIRDCWITLTSTDPHGPSLQFNPPPPLGLILLSIRACWICQTSTPRHGPKHPPRSLRRLPSVTYLHSLLSLVAAMQR